MQEMLSYREKTAVPSMNKVEGRVTEPCASCDIVNFKVDVLRRNPCRDRNWMGNL